MSESERLQSFRRLEDQLRTALAAGLREITLTIPVVEGLTLLDEIMDRPAVSLSRLIRDDLNEQAHSVLDRLHEESVYLISHGPAQTVAERHREDRPQPKERGRGATLAPPSAKSAARAADLVAGAAKSRSTRHPATKDAI